MADLVLLHGKILTMDSTRPQVEALAAKGDTIIFTGSDDKAQSHIDADTHDQLLARTSHLPHLVASLLVESLGDEAAELVSTGLLDTTRIASGDPAMWRDIFMTNRDGLLAAMERFESALAAAREAIESGDEAAVRSLLERAKQRRDDLLGSD